MMLTKESSEGFAPAKNYPTYEYKSRTGKVTHARLDNGRIEPPPKGFREVIRCATVDDAFGEYLVWIEDEYKALPDAKLMETPMGDFIGRWHNARWRDEIKRRGLS